jgi:hypothetical protein
MTDEHAVIERLFGGNATLFASFKAMTVAQFEVDASAGEAALAAGNAAALRRIAHNVKPALVLLGDDDGAARAQALERACVAAALPPAQECQALWAPLRRALLRAR